MKYLDKVVRQAVTTYLIYPQKSRTRLALGSCFLCLNNITPVHRGEEIVSFDVSKKTLKRPKHEGKFDTNSYDNASFV